MSAAMDKRVAKLETMIVPARSCEVCKGRKHYMVFSPAGPDDYRPAADGARPPMRICPGCGREGNKAYILSREAWEQNRDFWG